ncbi:MAG: Holliday junction branch migration protein RuvA, partial [Simkania negevensis]|nr:Holliday junction branch migration protein RuvA [Simkania negevensis]
QLLYDAQSALIHLGYNALQAQKAIKKALEHCEKTPSISELISAALQGSV